MKKIIFLCFLVICSFLIVSGCGPKFIRHDWVSVKIILDSDPTGAKVFDKYGVNLGTTPYVHEKKFAKQLWSDGDVIYYYDKENYKLGKNEEFTGIVSKEGYRRQLFEIPYEFEGQQLIIRKMIFLNR